MPRSSSTAPREQQHPEPGAGSALGTAESNLLVTPEPSLNTRAKLSTAETSGMLLNAETQTHRAAQRHSKQVCSQRSPGHCCCWCLRASRRSSPRRSRAQLPRHSKGLNPDCKHRTCSSTEDVLHSKPSPWHGPEQPETFQKENTRSSNVAST